MRCQGRSAAAASPDQPVAPADLPVAAEALHAAVTARADQVTAEAGELSLRRLLRLLEADLRLPPRSLATAAAKAAVLRWVSDLLVTAEQAQPGPERAQAGATEAQAVCSSRRRQDQVQAAAGAQRQQQPGGCAEPAAGRKGRCRGRTAGCAGAQLTTSGQSEQPTRTPATGCAAGADDVAAAAGSGADSPAVRLPSEVVVAILQQLDHDSVFQALQVCTAWRAAAQDPALWQSLYARARSDQEIPTGGGLRGAATWRTFYRSMRARSCYDCTTPMVGPGSTFAFGALVPRRTLPGAPLRLLLCAQCAAGYERRRPGQRLMPVGQAKHRYQLRDADLQGVPYAAEVNPINPNWVSMHLYRACDVRRAALVRWGGVEGMHAHYRPPLS